MIVRESAASILARMAILQSYLEPVAPPWVGPHFLPQPLDIGPRVTARHVGMQVFHTRSMAFLLRVVRR